MDQIDFFENWKYLWIKYIFLKIGSTYGSNRIVWKLEVPMDQIDFFRKLVVIMDQIDIFENWKYLWIK